MRSFHVKRGTHRKAHILSGTLGVLLMMTVLLSTVYAAGTHSIRLTAVDDWTDYPLSGTKVTLSEKVGTSYQSIAGKTNVTLPQTGMELTLPEGEYRLSIDATPTNYITSDQPIDFRVTAKGVTLVSAENAEAGENGASLTVFLALDYSGYGDTMQVLPSTGGAGTLPYLLAGALLMAAAAAGWCALRRGRARCL